MLGTGSIVDDSETVQTSAGNTATSRGELAQGKGETEADGKRKEVDAHAARMSAEFALAKDREGFRVFRQSVASRENKALLTWTETLLSEHGKVAISRKTTEAKMQLSRMVEYHGFTREHSAQGEGPGKIGTTRVCVSVGSFP